MRSEMHILTLRRVVRQAWVVVRNRVVVGGTGGKSGVLETSGPITVTTRAKATKIVTTAKTTAMKTTARVANVAVVVFVADVAIAIFATTARQPNKRYEQKQNNKHQQTDTSIHDNFSTSEDYNKVTRFGFFLSIS